MTPSEIHKIIESCLNYITKSDFKSYDIFDALTNPVINTLTAHTNFMRRAAIQVNSRSPVDLRWTGMRKMVHTKTISDLLFLYSIKERPDNHCNDASEDVGKIKMFFNKLVELKTPGFNAWGLNFPYTSRFVNASSSSPNLYNTINSAISICYCYNKLDPDVRVEASRTLEGTLKFINDNWWVIDDKGRGWYQYYSGQKYPTYNVNALTLYFLVLYQITTNEHNTALNDRILMLSELMCAEQNEEGSWSYARSKQGRWIDGFHIGFILDSLAFVHIKGYSNGQLDNALKKGLDYFLEHFFTEEGYAKYFSHSNKYPIDAQNYAQIIQTLALLGIWDLYHDKALLEGLISKAIRHLFDDRGYFCHKETMLFKFRTPYFRWSVTPMLIALEYSSQYLSKANLINEKVCRN